MGCGECRDQQALWLSPFASCVSLIDVLPPAPFLCSDSRQHGGLLGARSLPPCCHLSPDPHHGQHKYFYSHLTPRKLRLKEAGKSSSMMKAAASRQDPCLPPTRQYNSSHLTPQLPFPFSLLPLTMLLPL